MPNMDFSIDLIDGKTLKVFPPILQAESKPTGKVTKDFLKD